MNTSMPNASVILYRRILCSTIKHITPRSLTKLENVRALNSNIPTVRIATPDKDCKRPRVSIDDENIRLLERISLVDFANKEGIKRLEDAIAFADPIQDLDTTGIEPMYTVLENECLTLRNDEIDKNLPSREEILSNAVLTEEDYFVAPPGNIPLVVDKKKY